ncbi:S1 family peptidase [Amycolatopsis cihanbeyliensis]|uniref:Alpha-lytic protease prodomain-containing protein n=1 Tax=Amycolatopsis cihanbeyliensis TaxID=1128664 RepID=A0A542DQW0_AMYCI|nr:S1 family peptidase [Amycolatopsis cihanbeyliensis]TQJ05490.1 alpha-lytic protease prodomain-containing protein [Amycolatopsis cihanbeyliensis]
MRKTGPVAVAMLSAVLGAAMFSPSAAAAPETPSYDPAMLRALADRLDVSTEQAADTLNRESALTAALAEVRQHGVTTDGAFFDSTGALVVNVPDAASARAVGAEGLKARTGARGAQQLNAISDSMESIIGADIDQVRSWGPDVVSDTVTVTVEPGANADLTERLDALPGVSVRTGPGNTPTADVIPGRIMDLVPGTNCTLGFPGTTSDGDNVMLTAGHCVSGNPDIYDAAGNHLGQGVATQFPSTDMGLMDIDSEDTGRGYVDTRTGRTVDITGSSKAPIGTHLCKAGNTTGWTCGEITHYNQSVRYQGESTTTRGLARSTVCTEGGDSGGAYIAGNTAQGMTSGGPIGSECGFNEGDNATGYYSYYQPVVDAADYYGVALTRS